MPSPYDQCSNADLIRKEVKHRRRAKRIEAGLGLSTSLGISSIMMSGGVTAPMVIPFLGYKVYKLCSHQSKRDQIREELAKRDISPQDTSIRDVLNYVVGVSTPLVTNGINALVLK